MPGSAKDGSYTMKGFCVVLVVMMFLIPAMGVAQGTQTTSSPAPAAGAQEKPAPATAGKPAAVLTMVNPERYVIGADDSLQVTVWKEPTLSGTFPVRPDGMISLVLVGDMPAAGRTPMQLGDDISLRLKKYIQDPVVTVVVLAVNSQKVFLIGEVNHVGPIMLTPGMTPLQAIAAAGGLGTFASEKRIYILRTVSGKQEKIPFNYKKALKGDNSQGVSLQPGDTIVVP
jgi:polysaccharide biosynthesis/export protein